MAGILAAGSAPFVHAQDKVVLRYLGTLGRIVHVTTLLDALPEPEAFDPELCYLGCEIDLASAEDRDTSAMEAPPPCPPSPARPPQPPAPPEPPPAPPWGNIPQDALP